MVTVDDDFARFGAKSYAINKITSVEVREQRPHAAGCGVVMLAFVTVLFAIGAIGAPPLILVAALFGFATYKVWQRSKVVEYQLFLITTAAEQQAFVSRDQMAVADLRDQIEQAMARSGRS